MPRRVMKKRAPRRRRVAKKRNLGVAKGALKQYTYNFRLDDQLLYADTGSTTMATVIGGNGPMTNATSSLSTPLALNWRVQNNPIYGTNMVAIGGNLQFSIDDLKNWNPFKSLYDNYRINYIKLDVEYLCNQAGVAGTGLMPTLYAFVDQDGLPPPAVPILSSDVTDRQGFKKCTFTSTRTKWSIKIKPKLTVDVVPSLSGTNPALIQQSSSSWVDVQQDAALYKGLLFYIDNFLANGTASNAFRFSFTYNITLNGALNLH